MPQVFQVLKCYKCSAFQIHQTKKSNKFECKICGEKQSLKRHYGIGTGKECRLHVQRLNGMRGDKEEKYNISDRDEEHDDQIDESFIKHSKHSKWLVFVDEQKETEQKYIDEKNYLGDTEVLLELPSNRRTRRVKVNTKSLSNLDEYSYNGTNMSSIKLEIKLGESKNESNRFNDNVESRHISTSIQDYCLDNSGSKIASGESLTSSTYINQSNYNERKTPQKQTKRQTILKNLKWAEFMDTQKINEDIENYMHSNQLHETITHNLFTLCSDSEIDKVLDI